ncbi:12726_t:CDS:1, partial [Funneliformis caledonium]
VEARLFHYPLRKQYGNMSRKGYLLLFDKEYVLTDRQPNRTVTKYSSHQTEQLKCPYAT